jgi:hypothetical protein
MSRLAVVALLAVIPAYASAQTTAATSARFVPMRFASSSRLDSPMSDSGAFFHRRPLVFPSAFLADPFYSEALYGGGYPVASQPPVIVLQSPPANSRPDPPPIPTQPLLIELQGDNYVRISGEGTSGAEMISRESTLRRPSANEPDATTGRAEPASGQPVLAPVVLIFRDGHREEVSNYTNATGILYASGNYYTDGYWNKKIDLSSLDLAGTQRANADRNLRFILPSSPNEVVTRP